MSRFMNRFETGAGSTRKLDVDMRVGRRMDVDDDDDQEESRHLAEQRTNEPGLGSLRGGNMLVDKLT